MTTLTLTPLAADRAVRLAVAGAPAGAVTITRTDVNGTGPVRLLPGQQPIGGSLTTTDAEGALRGTLRYDVVDSSGAMTSSSTTLAGLVTLPQLGVPVLPQLGVEVEQVVELDARREQLGTVHEVVDRVDPVVVMRRLGTRRGRLQLYAVDHAAAQRIVDVYAAQQVVQLRQADHDRLDLYHVASSVGVVRASRSWRVEVDYVEVASPTAPLAGAVGWSFSDVLAGYGTFSAVRTSYATFADLAASRPR